MFVIDEEKKKETGLGDAYPIDSILDMISKSEGIDQSYRDIDMYLKEHSIVSHLICDFDFAAKLASGAEEIHIDSQCRKEGLDEDTVKEFVVQFEKKIAMIHPPIGAEIKGKVYVGVGNHRAYAKARLEQCDQFILIGEGLTDDQKRDLLREVASRSNTKQTSDKRTDSSADVIWQLQQAYRAIEDTDLSASDTLGGKNREWKKLLNKCETEEELDKTRRRWFDKWMNTRKPYSFQAKGTRTKIYNTAFTENSGQANTIAYTEADFKTIYAATFPGYEWDPDVYNFRKGEDIHQMHSQWNNRVENSPLNIKNSIWGLIFNSNLKNVGHKDEVHLIVSGDTGARTPAGRKKHIEMWLNAITQSWNRNNMREKMEHLPLISKVIFTRSLNGCNDQHFAYILNTQSKEFVEVERVEHTQTPKKKV